MIFTYLATTCLSMLLCLVALVALYGLIEMNRMACELFFSNEEDLMIKRFIPIMIIACDLFILFVVFSLMSISIEGTIK